MRPQVGAGAEHREEGLASTGHREVEGGGDGAFDLVRVRVRIRVRVRLRLRVRGRNRVRDGAFDQRGSGGTRSAAHTPPLRAEERQLAPLA